MKINPKQWHHVEDISCYNNNWYRMNFEDWKISEEFNPKHYTGKESWTYSSPFIHEKCDDDDGFFYRLYKNLSDFFSDKYEDLGDYYGICGIFGDDIDIIDTDDFFKD